MRGKVLWFALGWFLSNGLLTRQRYDLFMTEVRAWEAVRQGGIPRWWDWLRGNILF